jgi:hypothetical protein
MLNLKKGNPKNGIQIVYTWRLTLAVRSGMSVAANFYVESRDKGIKWEHLILLGFEF